MTLTLTPLPGLPMVQAGDDLAALILAGLDRAGLVLQGGDVLVIAQKIVSKAEGRLLDLRRVTPSARAYDLARVTRKDPRLVEAILSESREVLRARPGVMIVEHRLGFICASAGVDHSNIGVDVDDLEDWVLLLPEDPDRSARELRTCLLARLSCPPDLPLGLAIIDSHGRAWRNGTAGVTIGLAGLPGVQDLRGQPDLFDFQLQITQVGVADELAAAASLVMGQAREGTPVVHVRGFPYPLRNGSLQELLRSKNEDMFR